MGKKIIKKVQKKIESEEEEEIEDNIEDQELSESESDSEIEQEEEQKKIINNTDVMKQKIQSIQNEFKRRLKLDKKQAVNWHDHMSIVGDDKVEMQKLDINDDIQREVQFYNIALDNAKLALKYLESENIPIRRPDDYFADMFKNDKHMGKIKSRLVAQQVKVQSFEEKQLRAQSKKLSKKIKARTEFKKHDEKKQNLQAIDNWKQEIKNKGEKARDLSDFMLKKGNMSKKPQQTGKPQQYSKFQKNSGGGKMATQKHGKTIQKDKQQNKAKGGKGQGKGKSARPSKSSRHHKSSKGKGGSKGKKAKRGHQ